MLPQLKLYEQRVQGVQLAHIIFVSQNLDDLFGWFQEEGLYAYSRAEDAPLPDSLSGELHELEMVAAGAARNPTQPEKIVEGKGVKFTALPAAERTVSFDNFASSADYIILDVRCRMWLVRLMLTVFRIWAECGRRCRIPLSH